MTRERWWDGCDRVVVSTRKGKAPGYSSLVTFVLLDCGHEQVGPPMKLPEADICRNCAAGLPPGPGHGHYEPLEVES